MSEIADEWRLKRLPRPVRAPLVAMQGAAAAITLPPQRIVPFLLSLHPFQRLRHYRRAIREIERVLRLDNLAPDEHIYLLIKQAELTRRRAVPGAVATAMEILDRLDPSAVPAKYRPLFYYELCYNHRLLGRHAAAASWSRKSARAIKGPQNAAYIAAVTNEILCEIAASDRLPSTAAIRIERQLRKLEAAAMREGGFWGGRWTVNCAVTGVELQLKVGHAAPTWNAMARLRDLYYGWDVSSGWDLAARPTITQLEGLVRIEFPRNDADLHIALELLSRAFVTRLAPRQRPEGIRDIGFALAAGLLKTKRPRAMRTAAVLKRVMARTVDGTSVQDPWRG
jgi:hypothetical protein